LCAAVYMLGVFKTGESRKSEIVIQIGSNLF
jgi:hypothetical protein